MKFYTVPEVAKILGLSERHVWREIADAEVGSHGFGRATRVSEDDLKDYIRRKRRKRNIPKQKQRRKNFE